MVTSKVHKVLANFSAPKLNQFVKFVQSPYFNVNEDLTKYAVLLVDSLKNNKKHTKLEFYQLLNEGEEYNDQKFRTLSSKLIELVQRFLIQEQFSSNQLEQDIYLLGGIRINKLEVLNKKAIDNAGRNFERNLNRSSDFYLNRYKYELNLFKGINEFEKKMIKADPLGSTNLFEINPPLDTFYFVSKLRYINELLTYNYMYKLNIALDEFDFIEKAVITKDLLKIPSVNIYYLLCKALMHPEEEDYYRKVIKLIHQHMEIFDSIEKRELFNSFLNYTIKKVNKGDKKYYDEILDLYELGIEQEILLLDGKLSATSFRNIVVAAIRIDKYDYAKKFIANNANLLADEDRNNAVNFSLARIAMNLKEWEKAIEHISVTDFEDESYNLNSRLMMLNAYYELKEYNSLESLIDSYSVFLRRKKFIALQISYLNHLRYLRKIVRVNRNEKDKIEIIKKEITKNTQVINKQWLIEKADELL